MAVMSEPLVFLHGRLVPQSQAGLALHDAGFVMGATVTDLCRTFHHNPYRWSDHLTRFTQSCRLAALELPLRLEEVTARAEELVRRNAALLTPGQELALVLFATPGPIGYYLGEPGGAGDGPVTFGIHTFPLPFARYRPWIERGAALVVPTIRHISATGIDPHIKMRSRLNWWLADREVHRLDPAAIALLRDETDTITETASANILVVRDGTVVSPPRDRILEGISLRVVAELCARLEIPFEERPLSVQELETADAAMLASTPYCLVGVSRCNGAALPWPGTVLPRLLAAWNHEVGLDIHSQILAVP